MKAPLWMEQVVPAAFDNDIIPFWEGLKRHQFLLHRCRRCGTHYWPMTLCPHHDDGVLDEMEWVPTSGRGQVFSWGIVHRVGNPSFKDDAPYALVLVELEEGPIFPSRLVDRPPPDLRVGLPVEITYRDVPETGMTLPLFKPIP